MDDEESSKSNPIDPINPKPSSTRTAPKGTRRHHSFVSETRVIKRPPLQEFAIHLCSMVLILIIMYLDIVIVRKTSLSVDGRTRFISLLITLCLPAIIYGVIQLLTRRARLVGLCVKSSLGIIILSIILQSFEALEILWFTPACFAFSYLVVQIKDRWRNRKQGVILPPVKEREPGVDEDDSHRRRRRYPSRSQHYGWANAFYSYFRMKRN